MLLRNGIRAIVKTTPLFLISLVSGFKVSYSIELTLNLEPE